MAKQPDIRIDAEVLAAFSANIAAARQRLGLSLYEVGRRSLTTATGISRIEQGLHVPMLGLAVRIADALGTTVDDLLKDKKGKRK